MNFAASTVQIHILQPRSIAAKSFVFHMARFLDPPLIEDLPYMIFCLKKQTALLKF